MKKIIIIIVFVLFILNLMVLGAEDNFNNGDYSNLNEDIEISGYYRAQVLEVQDFDSQNNVFELFQKATVIITSGPYRGQVYNIDNHYHSNHPYSNIYLQEKMRVILIGEENEGQLEAVYLHEVARDRILLYLLIFFISLILIIGGIHGLKNLLILSYSGLIILKVMIPLLLRGYHPINLTLLITILIVIPMLLIIGGFKLKSLSAILGTIIGVITGGIIALVVSRLAFLTGLSGEGPQMLIILEESIDLQGLLFAGIIIGSLGAITDVCISVASAVFEIKKQQNHLSRKELVKKGLDIGRDRMESRANILLLAYIGSAVPLMLLFASAKTNWIKILNMDLIVTEIVRGLSGSIGLIVSIPATALIAGLIATKKYDSN